MDWATQVPPGLNIFKESCLTPHISLEILILRKLEADSKAEKSEINNSNQHLVFAQHILSEISESAERWISQPHRTSVEQIRGSFQHFWDGMHSFSLSLSLEQLLGTWHRPGLGTGAGRWALGRRAWRKARFSWLSGGRLAAPPGVTWSHCGDISPLPSRPRRLLTSKGEAVGPILFYFEQMETSAAASSLIPRMRLTLSVEESRREPRSEWPTPDSFLCVGHTLFPTPRWLWPSLTLFISSCFMLEHSFLDHSGKLLIWPMLNWDESSFQIYRDLLLVVF